MNKGMILIAVFALLSIALPVLAVFNILPPLIYILASLGVGMAMVITMVIAYVFTNGILEPALAARMSGKALWIIITATRRFKLVSGSTDQRLFQTGKDGSFIIDPEASFSWPHGVSGSIAIANRGCNLNPDLVQAATNLKEIGIGDSKALDTSVAELKAAGKDALALPAEQSIVGRPLRFSDVSDFFHNNLNPSYIQSVIKMSVANALEGKKDFPIALVMGISILMICAGIAYLIITGAQSGSGSAQLLAQCQNQLAGCSARVVTPTATTTTVPGIFQQGMSVT